MATVDADECLTGRARRHRRCNCDDHPRLAAQSQRAVASVARRTAPGTRHCRGRRGPCHRAHPPGPGVLRRRRPEGTIVAGRHRPDSTPESNSDSNPFVEALVRLMDTERPTIAAVNGAVRAGGIGLMAACDLVVVAASTTFALTEVRIGVAPAIISVPILRRVAPSRIAAAMLTGESFDAHEARSMGLITHVSADVAATVEALTTGILAGALHVPSPRRSGCSAPSARWIAPRHFRRWRGCRTRSSRVPKLPKAWPRSLPSVRPCGPGDDDETMTTRP